MHELSEINQNPDQDAGALLVPALGEQAASPNQNGKDTRQKVWLKAILDSAAEISRLGRAVRTQSNSAFGNAELLHEPVKENQRQRVEDFRRAVANLLTLVNNYLDISNIESGEFELEQIDFELKLILERALTSIGAAADKKKLVLKLMLVPGIPRTLAGDATRLEQILANLLNNAVQFAEAGQIHLRAEPDAANPCCVHIMVAYCGSGMPGEQREGIGLCRILLRQMGAELILRQEAGDEKAFHFAVAFAPGRRAVEIEGAAAPTKCIRILIAEDSEDSRFLLQEFLKRGPYEITFAENGKTALEAALSQPFDLILMDIQMPVMDGLTAARLIREAEQREGRTSIPLLALTAHNRKADIDLSIAAGCNAHLSKPISKSGLLETIQKHLPVCTAEAKLADAPSIRLNIPQGLEEAAKMYISSKKNDVPRLLQLVQDKQFEELRKLAHDLKGNGASYGFAELTRLGDMLESSAKEQNSRELSSQLLELSRYVQAASELANGSPAQVNEVEAIA